MKRLSSKIKGLSITIIYIIDNQMCLASRMPLPFKTILAA